MLSLPHFSPFCLGYLIQWHYQLVAIHWMWLVKLFCLLLLGVLSSSTSLLLFVYNLTVDALLGVDFLTRHRATVDCVKGCLTLAAEEVPFIHTGSDSHQPSGTASSSFPITVLETIVIPGRSLLFVTARLNGASCKTVPDTGLIEPILGAATPKRILIDRVWLYTPAIKTGQSKKLSASWRGPYTIVDKCGLLDYKLQLIGGTKSLIVHHNRLKPCYGPSFGGQSSPPNSRSHLPVPHTPSTTLPVGSGGYTSVSPDPVTIPTTIPPPPIAPPAPVGTPPSPRPQRTRRPPICLGDFIPH